MVALALPCRHSRAALELCVRVERYAEPAWHCADIGIGLFVAVWITLLRTAHTEPGTKASLEWCHRELG